MSDPFKRKRWEEEEDEGEYGVASRHELIPMHHSVPAPLLSFFFTSLYSLFESVLSFLKAFALLMLMLIPFLLSLSLSFMTCYANFSLRLHHGSPIR